jgi:hypothetical protein
MKLINTKNLFLIITSAFLLSCQQEEDNKYSGNSEENPQDSSRISSELDTTEFNLTIEVPDSFKRCILNIDSLFPTIELPLALNYKFFSTFDRKKNKTIIPYSFTNIQTSEYDGLPISVLYSLGKIQLTDSTEFYLIVTGMNPNNPMDLYFISLDIYLLKHGKLVYGGELAKYHYASNVTEEYYSTIHKNEIVKMKYQHKGEYDTIVDVFKSGDTTFSLKERIFTIPFGRI